MIRAAQRTSELQRLQRDRRVYNMTGEMISDEDVDDNAVISSWDEVQHLDATPFYYYQTLGKSEKQMANVEGEVAQKATWNPDPNLDAVRESMNKSLGFVGLQQQQSQLKRERLFTSYHAAIEEYFARCLEQNVMVEDRRFLQYWNREHVLLHHQASFQDRLLEHDSQDKREQFFDKLMEQRVDMETKKPKGRYFVQRSEKRKHLIREHIAASSLPQYEGSGGLIGNAVTEEYAEKRDSAFVAAFGLDPKLQPIKEQASNLYLHICGHIYCHFLVKFAHFWLDEQMTEVGCVGSPDGIEKMANSYIEEAFLKSFKLDDV